KDVTNFLQPEAVTYEITPGGITKKNTRTYYNIVRTRIDGQERTYEGADYLLGNFWMMGGAKKLLESKRPEAKVAPAVRPSSLAANLRSFDVSIVSDIHPKVTEVILAPMHGVTRSFGGLFSSPRVIIEKDKATPASKIGINPASGTTKDGLNNVIDMGEGVKIHVVLGHNKEGNSHKYDLVVDNKVVDSFTHANPEVAFATAKNSAEQMVIKQREIREKNVPTAPKPVSMPNAGRKSVEVTKPGQASVAPEVIFQGFSYGLKGEDLRNKIEIVVMKEKKDSLSRLEAFEAHSRGNIRGYIEVADGLKNGDSVIADDGREFEVVRYGDVHDAKSGKMLKETSLFIKEKKTDEVFTHYFGERSVVVDLLDNSRVIRNSAKDNFVQKPSAIAKPAPKPV
ncbi:MAG TPA: hypothetical protein DHV62_10920, partial [Elusimicrobia bacterium]|nr:hypothetical protein [Elusimicrobiota bacterium]